MIWVLLIGLVILWAFVQKAVIENTGSMPRSRGSMRYQRRKARKLGVDPEDVEINPRLDPASDYEIAKRKIDALSPYLWAFIIIVLALWIIPELIR